MKKYVALLLFCLVLLLSACDGDPSVSHTEGGAAPAPSAALTETGGTETEKGSSEQSETVTEGEAQGDTTAEETTAEETTAEETTTRGDDIDLPKVEF